MVGSLVNASPTVARRDNEKAVEAVCFCQDGMTIRERGQKNTARLSGFPGQVPVEHEEGRGGEGAGLVPAGGSGVLTAPWAFAAADRGKPGDGIMIIGAPTRRSGTTDQAR
jgi:hypothetical protein